MAADPNKSSSNGRTPLCAASENGHDQVVHILCKHGANPDQTDHEGVGPVYLAAKHGHQTVLAYLLAYGARPDVVTNDGQETPLHVAAANGHYEIVKMLYSLCPDLADAVDTQGHRPIDKARNQGHGRVVEYLSQ